MNGNDISRYGKRFVQYFWDPMPTNQSEVPIWCLGERYESQPVQAQIQQTPKAKPVPQEVKADTQQSKEKSTEESELDISGLEIVERSESADRDEALSKGWPAKFLDDVETRIWLTYRNNFPPIAKATDPAALGAMSFSTRLKQLGNQGGFTSDTGWGCMIRSGQSLLANTLAEMELGRDWRRGAQVEKEQKLLSFFADDPAAPFSIHRFVEHGAAKCGKHPGEWFGPSATARCIQALVDAHHPSGLMVYVRDDSDVYEDSFLAVAKPSTEPFQPTLILLGTRLGIDRINPIYHGSLAAILSSKYSVGIAGGRPSSSHYFFGVQGSNFFYLDPHYTRPLLHLDPTVEDVASCHTQKLRRIEVEEMDPSMLLGFLIRSEEEWKQWRKELDAGSAKGRIVHIHDREPSFNDEGGVTGKVREEAVDEVISCDEDDDATVIS